METSTATTETLDKKIQSIKDVLSKKVSASDEQSLKRMLMEAMEEKQRLMESQLSSLKAKYGVQSQSQDVVIVDSPPQTKSLSSSDEGGSSGRPYSLEEMNALYDVMENEDL